MEAMLLKRKALKHSPESEIRGDLGAELSTFKDL